MVLHFLMNCLRLVFYKLYLNCIGAVYEVKEHVLDRHRSPAIPSDLQGRNVVITGGSRGIGLEAVRKMLRLNCTVVVGCRSVDQARAALGTEDSSRLRVLPLDLMKLESVRAFAAEVKQLQLPLHALVNNAGIMFGPRRQTEDGFEAQLATNYVGHFLLSHLLLEDLERGGTPESPARIVNVSSCAHYIGSWMDFDDLNLTKFYSPEQSYGNSKAAQVMFSQFLDSRLSNLSKVRVIALHPGVVYSDLYSEVWWTRIFTFFAKFIMKTASEGGDTIVHATLAPELNHAQTTGLYLENSQLRRISSFTSSLENQSKLWDKTCQMLEISSFGSPAGRS